MKWIRHRAAGWPTRMSKPFAAKGVGACARACSQHPAFAGIASPDARRCDRCDPQPGSAHCAI